PGVPGSFSRGTLHDHGDSLPAPNARRCQAVALLTAPQFVQDGEHQARTRRGEWMAQRDRATIDIQLLSVDPELLDHGEDLPSDGLVDLDQIDVVELHSRLLEGDLRRRHRTDAHDVRITPGNAPGNDAA